MHIQISHFIPLSLFMTLALSACGGAGGSSGLGSGGATVNRASGVLALPSATCGGGACVSSVSGFGALSMKSSDILLENAEFGYEYINTTFVPLVNQKMYELEQAFKSNDLDQCGSSDVSLAARQIDQVPDGTYPLNATTNVVVSSSGLHSAPYTMEKKFVVQISGTSTVEVQVGCPSTTTRSIYVRLKEGNDLFEAWGHQTPSEKVIYAASDTGSTAKRTLFFKSTSASIFEIGAIVKDATLNGGSPLSLAISGGADLLSSTGKLEVNFLMNPTTALTASAGATFENVEDPYGGANNKRHCYTNLAPATLSTTSSDCATLFQGPGSAYLRGGVQTLTDWSVNSLGSASISSTF